MLCLGLSQHFCRLLTYLGELVAPARLQPRFRHSRTTRQRLAPAGYSPHRDTWQMTASRGLRRLAERYRQDLLREAEQERRRRELEPAR